MQRKGRLQGVTYKQEGNGSHQQLKLTPLGKSPCQQGQEGLKYKYNIIQSFEIRDKRAFYSHLSEGKGNVNEDCNEDFIRDPRQARKPFTSSNNLM